MKRAKVLRELVEKTGMSVKAFSEKAGLPYTTVRSIFERGVSKSSVDNVIKICRALGITIEELEILSEKGAQHVTLAANRADGYDEPLTEDEAAAVKAFLETYRKMKKTKED